jgi:hypothetical protein
MLERYPMTAGVLIILLFAILFFVKPCRAADIEMRLKVANGTTERDESIRDPEMTPMACIFTAQVAASDWVRKNLGENWRVLRITCGPVRIGL